MSLFKRFACRAFSVLIAVLVSTSAYSLSYTVKPSDTLFGLALEYDVPQKWIMRINGLDDAALQIGQELTIPVDGIKTVTVRPGDTLSALSVEFDVSVDEILAENDMDSSDLRIGRKLRIPESIPENQHRVIPGDSLSSIARRYNLSVALLKAFNSLEDDVIRPGDILLVIPERREVHPVGDGESLWTIAADYDLTMSDLREWNDIKGDVIHPGEVLALYPGIDVKSYDSTIQTPLHFDTPNTTVALAAVKTETQDRNTDSEELPRFGEYFFNAPRKENQPDNTYWEEPVASALTDYRRSTEVLSAFIGDIDELSPLSKSLTGWHIVIDPGHGGLDPGAIVTVLDGNGNPLTVTEDEYAYDISMRMYQALSRHGASVSMTILSPDHHIRDGEDARQTFVHRKNEVYNQESHNGNAGWRPVGTTEGLDLRKEIAADQIASAPGLAKRKGTLYISVHADNSADLPAGRAVLFDGMSSSETEASRSLASIMASNLGAGSFIKEQPLRVLRNNPADAAVLVEVRNIHYDRNCWALRSSELREQDALMVVDGILDWASRN